MRPTLLVTLALLAIPGFAASPAETAIRQATADIAKQPSFYGHYNELAMAYARRARETSDSQFYATAEATLRKSFALKPGNFDGRKVETFLELEHHEYARALADATQLNRMVPDDLSVYGYLVDANAELGNYRDAIDAAQWMLDLRPGNPGGFIHAAYLRELYGNLAGAVELLDLAYNATPPSESEDRAWILAQTAHVELISGDLAKAEQCASDALRRFPDSPYGLAALAQVRQAQGRYDEASALLLQRYQSSPRPENLYALAEAQALAGQHDQALTSFRKFEAQASAEAELPDNSNRELIAYYVDHAASPARALAIARREIARRHDVFTLDSYAWALAATGDYAGAERQIQAALQMGVKDQTVLYHAGSIALHQHKEKEAQTYLKDAAARNSRDAAKLLASMGSE